MNIFTTFKLAVRALWRNKVRTMLTMLGIVFREIDEPPRSFDGVGFFENRLSARIEPSGSVGE